MKRGQKLSRSRRRAAREMSARRHQLACHLPAIRGAANVTIMAAVLGVQQVPGESWRKLRNRTADHIRAWWHRPGVRVEILELIKP